jgi:glucose-6-phosphate isomerase
MSLTSSPVWRNLAVHSKKLRKETAFTPADIARLDDFSLSLIGLHLNYCCQNATQETLDLLLALAKQQQVEENRARLFAGDKINTTENRAVLHTALRRNDNTPILVDGVDIMPDIRATQNRIAAFVDDVRGGAWRGATGKIFKHIVNIGIGGSDLGPRLAVQALSDFIEGVSLHFIANIDAFEIDSVLQKCDAAQTLFVVVSKTFSTQETLVNARTARQWLIDELGEKAVAKHFVAVSANRDAVEKFGIHADNIFPMWDWVGGRYSLWSSVGLSVALAIGNENFRALLNGAAAMDAHFQSAPLHQNMPVILALLAVWNRNFLNAPAVAILPYCERLRDFPRFLQQLEMESNGKSVTREGAAIDYETGPILFGECGTVGQHSFHQWLHQGTTPIPCDFIGVAEDDRQKPEHHRILLTNMVAQMGALAFGQKQAASSHDIYTGHRSSNLILLDRLDPYRLGLLLALYEHKTFVQGVVWGINSFDQPGVELGKRIAKGLEANSTPSSDSGDFLSLLLQKISLS